MHFLNLFGDVQAQGNMILLECFSFATVWLNLALLMNSETVNFPSFGFSRYFDAFAMYCCFALDVSTEISFIAVVFRVNELKVGR